MSLVTARLMPVSISRVPNVIKKLGILVFITRYPLKNPTPSATSSANPAPTHRFRCRLYASIDAASELVVTATPDDRSNSPPIINNATAHAMIPIVELA